MVKRNQLEKYLNGLLDIKSFEDYVPNGLQIEGKENISSMIASPSISAKLVKRAIEAKKDAILVHHGFFWKNLPNVLTGEYRNKIKAILENNINLFAYHLPLDFHPEFGNNRPVLVKLGAQKITPFMNIGYLGELKVPLTAEEFHNRLKGFFQNQGICIPKDGKIRKVVMVSGNGTSYFQGAIDCRADAFVTGEGTEWIYQMCQDSNVAYYAMGHYKTECIGPALLGKHLKTKFKIDFEMFEEENPF